MKSVYADIERFIRTEEGDFTSLATALFAHQFEANSPYQAYCRALGKTPDGITRWQDIPAVPIRAFKSAALSTFPPARAAAVFHSSTTTGTEPSRHYIRDLSFYESSLQSGFLKWVLKGDQSGTKPFLILTPAPGEAPRSSLTWMMDVAQRTWGAAGSAYFILRGRIEESRLVSALAKAEAEGKSVILMGTTLAFLAFFDELARLKRSFQLPSGSRLMDTGGMKTEKREITREAFVASAQRLLGIPASDCVNEYGMCELSSQFYSVGNDAVLRGPAWVRVSVVHPDTAEAVAPGEKGLLRYFDLANVDSVAAIQADDLGRLHEDGFKLLGRAPGADLKGCSLAAEKLLGLK
jgi:hypothetical protein